MMNNLYVLSFQNAANQVFRPKSNTSALPLPRFGRQYDHYDHKVSSAQTLPAKLSYMAERFVATTTPDLALTDIEDLTPHNLKKLGHVKGIIFDLDDTLMPILSGKFPEPVIKTLKHLKKAGYQMGVVTNNMQPEYCRNARALLHKEGLDLPFIEDATKPSPVGFTAMQAHFGLPAEQVAVVGDGYLSDMRCANLLGMASVQACWFSQYTLGATTCYALDTVAAIFQTARTYLGATTEPKILTVATDAENHPD